MSWSIGSSWSPALFNIVTGRLAEPFVNVHIAIQIGTNAIESHADKLPEGFHDLISSPPFPMSADRKTANLGSGQRFDTSIIFCRTLGIMNPHDLIFMWESILIWIITNPQFTLPRWWQYCDRRENPSWRISLGWAINEKPDTSWQHHARWICCTVVCSQH